MKPLNHLLHFFFMISAFALFGQDTLVPKLMPPIGHSINIRSAQYSPDGKFIVTAGADQTAKVWDLQYKKVVLIFPKVSNAFFSPDGKQIVTAYYNTATTRDAKTGQQLQIFNHNNKVRSPHYSSDGSRIVTACFDHTATTWDAKTGQQLQVFQGHKDRVYSAQYSPDSKYIVTASYDSTAIIWDEHTGQQLQQLRGHSNRVYSARYSPDGSRIVTASFDSTAIIWDAKTGQQLHQLKGHKNRVYSAQYSPDGKYIVTASYDSTAIIWEERTGQQLQHLKGHKSRLYSAQYSPDGGNILTISWDVSAKIWNLQNKKLITELRGHTASLYNASFDPTGKQIVTAGLDSKIKLWDVQKGRISSVLSGHKKWVCSAEYSPDGKHIVSSSGDKTAIIWNTQTGQQKQKLKGHTNQVRFARYSPDGKSIVTASWDKTAIIWNTQTGQILHELKHSTWALSPQYSPDGEQIITAGGDRRAIIWNAKTGQKTQELIGHSGSVYSVQYSPNGRQIVTASRDNTAKIWDAKTGAQLQGLIGHTSPIYSAQFSPCGKYIVTASYDNTARIWAAKSGTQLQGLLNHTDIIAAKYSPDGNLILTVSLDGSFKLWSAKSYKELISITPIDSIDWVATHPSGLFDATPGAMDKMYYLLGLEVIEFEQLKERYYEPGLYQKVMAGDPLRNVNKFGALDMYPVITPQIKNHELQIHLKERNGGLGKTSIFINNKEILADANTNRDTFFSIDLTSFEKFYLPDTVNQIGIRTYNADGWLKSHLFTLDYFPGFINKNDQAGTEETLSLATYQPHYYAIIVGTSDYNGQQLDLRYADKDAKDISQALRQTAHSLFGEDKVHLEWFSTDTQSGSRLASKENIKAAFESFASTARSEDVLTIYFSGHGTTYGGTENEQFYYLTKDVYSGDLSDPAIRNNYAISTEELTQWVTAIPAQKQVMILDACSSGKVVEDLLAVRDIPTSQIRALDRMKDRTGMFVLAGSAADKVSYEASQFGQGLLTYSLLLGMSGAALRENKSVDVMQLFQFARDKVPEFAEDIGGIQTPTLAFPTDASSFDIGLVTEGMEIPLEEVKPVFIRSNFQDEERIVDAIRLSETLDEHLLNVSTAVTSRGIIFVDVNRYKNAYSVGGRYLLKGNQIILNGMLFKDIEVVDKFKLQGDTEDLRALVRNILAEVDRILE